MFDFGQLIERVASNFNLQDLQDTVSAGSPLELLSNLGVDPSQLEGLPVDEVVRTLTEAGLDPADLAELDVEAIIAGLTGGQ